MFKEYDKVRLVRNVEVHYLDGNEPTKYRKGEKGTILDIAKGNNGTLGYLVEFDGYDKKGEYFSKYDFFKENDLELIHREENDE